MGCAQNGGPSAAGFRRWVDGFARGIGSHRAVVFVESDGIASSNCLRGTALSFRLGLIAYEVRRLAALPNTGVYIDAGAADWLRPERAAQLLRRVGVGGVRGFVLDPTHYEWTHTQIAHGTRISRLLGGKHFVVNTALNGRGPLMPRDRVRYGNEVWCNPAGRSLGPLPTLRTGNGLVDAFFWVSPPGMSDGPCGNAPGSMPGPRTHGGLVALLGARAHGQREPFARLPPLSRLNGAPSTLGDRNVSLLDLDSGRDRRRGARRGDHRDHEARLSRARSPRRPGSSGRGGSVSPRRMAAGASSVSQPASSSSPRTSRSAAASPSRRPGGRRWSSWASEATSCTRPSRSSVRV